MADQINVGGIEADVILNTDALEAELARTEKQLEKVGEAIKRLQSSFEGSTSTIEAEAQKLQQLIAVQGALIQKTEQLQAARAEAASQDSTNVFLESLAKQDAADEAFAKSREGRLNASLAKQDAAEQESTTKKVALAEAAGAKGYEIRDRMVNDILAAIAKEDAAEATSEAKEIDRLTRVEAAYHASLAKRDAAAEAFAAKEETRQQKLVSDYLADQAKKDAADAARIARQESTRQRSNVDAGNWVLGQMTIQPAEAQAMATATEAAAKAEADLARAAKTASTEQDRLNHFLEVAAAHAATATTAIDATAGATAKATAGAQRMGVALQETQHRSAAFARGMMQLGYMVDDIQYGFGSVVNNIAPLTQAFASAAGASIAMSMGISAGVQISAVAAYQLYTHWDKLNDALGMGRVRTEAEAMEELGKQTKKTAEETDKLNQYKREQSEMAAMRIARPKEEEDAAKAVKELVKEGDFDKIQKGLFEAINSDPQERSKLTHEEKAKIEAFHPEDNQSGKLAEEIGSAVGLDMKDIDVSKIGHYISRAGIHALTFGTLLAYPNEQVDALGMDEQKRSKRAAKETEAEITKRDQERSNKLLVEAEHDPEKLKQLIKIVKAKPGSFPAGFQGGLEDQLPENRKSQKEFEEGGKSNIARYHDQIAKEKLIDKEWDETNKELDDHSREVKQRKTKDKERHRENLVKAEAVIPNLEEEAESAILKSRIGGAPMKDVHAMIKAALQRGRAVPGKVDDFGKQVFEGGLNEQEAEEAAGDTLKKGGKEVDKKISDRRLKGEGRRYQPRKEHQQEIRKSEIFGTGDLTSKIQGSIANGDERKKQTGLQEKQVSLAERSLTYLAKLTEQPGLVIGVKE